MFVAHCAASLIECCFVKIILSETPAMGILFYFPKLNASATIISVVAGYRAMLESNPSTATTYTGYGRFNRRLSFSSIQAAKSDKLQPASGGLIKTVKRCASN
jgi:hypothetical protein